MSDLQLVLSFVGTQATFVVAVLCWHASRAVDRPCPSEVLTDGVE